MKVKVTYLSNGSSQILNFILQETYIYEIKPILNKIYELEVRRSNLGKKNKEGLLIDKEVVQLKKELSEYGDYFTSDSPLGKALTTGVLKLPPQQGGNHLVKFMVLS